MSNFQLTIFVYQSKILEYKCMHIFINYNQMNIILREKEAKWRKMMSSRYDAKTFLSSLYTRKKRSKRTLCRIKVYGSKCCWSFFLVGCGLPIMPIGKIIIRWLKGWLHFTKLWNLAKYFLWCKYKSFHWYSFQFNVISWR